MKIYRATTMKEVKGSIGSHRRLWAERHGQQHQKVSRISSVVFFNQHVIDPASKQPSCFYGKKIPTTVKSRLPSFKVSAVHSKIPITINCLFEGTITEQYQTDHGLTDFWCSQFNNLISSKRFPKKIRPSLYTYHKIVIDCWFKLNIWATVWKSLQSWLSKAA